MNQVPSECHGEEDGALEKASLQDQAALLFPLDAPKSLEIEMLTWSLTRHAAVILLLAWPALSLHAQPAADPLAGLDAQVMSELDRFRTPGVSIAIVKDGKVLLAKGYGLRNVEQKLPMTAETVQPIASITKSFTVAALATLVRDGKLAWDQPVRELLPEFRLWNDELTARVTVRDLVTHRTGLPRHDGAWFGSPLSREQLLQRLRFLEPSAGLRERFQYNNFMYMTAGYLGGRIAGKGWESLIQESLFDPLGMRRSSLTLAGLNAQADRGSGYTLDDDRKAKPQPYQALDAMGPTGSINSSANDMARYLLMLTQRGAIEGRTVVTPADLAAMTSPQMVLPFRGKYPEFGPAQYGMGTFIGSYRGQRYFSHGGDMPGSASDLWVFPAQNLGIFVSGNLSGSRARSTLPYAIADRLLGLPPVDWSTRLKAEDDEFWASDKAAAQQRVDPQVPGTRPARPLADYAGDYEHPAYGVLNVTISGAAERPLRVNYNGMSSNAAHFHFEVFKVPDDKLDLLEQTKLQFVTNLEGDVAEVRVRMEPNVPPIAFKRQPDARLKDPKVLARFVGEYVIAGNPMVVALRADGVLTLSTPGQPVYELAGLTGSRFAVKGPGDRQLLFRGPTDGAAVDVAVLSSWGNFIAPKKR